MKSFTCTQSKANTHSAAVVLTELGPKITTQPLKVGNTKLKRGDTVRSRAEDMLDAHYDTKRQNLARQRRKPCRSSLKGANKARGRGAGDGCVCAVRVCVSGYVVC